MSKFAFLALAMLSGCASYADTPPDPALANVRILVIEMDAKQIAAAKVGLQSNDAVKFTTLAYSIVDKINRQCVVVLPKDAEPAFRKKLLDHETRHCHGEMHPDRVRFRDEFPF
jgi:hypothetical protein